MNFPTVFLALGAIVSCSEASITFLGIKGLDLTNKIPHGIQKLYTRLNANELILMQDPIDDPLPIDASEEYFSIDNTQISGQLSWGNGSIKGLANLTYYDSPILECSYNPGDTMFSWAGDVPNVILEMPSIDFVIGYFGTDFNINLLTIKGSNLELGISDVFASALAKGNCNDEEITISSIALELGTKFLTTANGELTLNGDEVSLNEIRDELNNLFETVWNTRTQPLFQNYLKCAVNIALEDCSEGTIATCAKEPGINNQRCKDELENLWSNPIKYSGAGSVFFSWFNLIALASLALLNIW